MTVELYGQVGRTHNTIKTSPCQGKAACVRMDAMEIVILDTQSIRIKGKTGAILLDPLLSGKTKFAGDAVLFFTKKEQNTSKIEGLRLVIMGPGEYEIGGIKMSGFAAGEDIAYTFAVDGVNICAVTSRSLTKVAEKIKDCDVLVVRADSEVTDTAITNISPKVVALYNEMAAAGVKVLGKEEASVKKTNKLVVTHDKLPEEMEVVLLG